MGRFNLKALVSCSLTAGLLMASATATHAADPPAQSSAGGRDTGQANANAGQATAADNQSPTGQSSSADGQARAAENQAAAGGNAADNTNGNGAGSDPGTKADEPDPRPGPPGNNGTIKIDGVDFDSHPNNEPHVDCIFEIDFYGFDANQNVTVSFVLQAPTTGGTITGTAPSGTTLDGDDNSFGGSERGLDGSLRYTLGFTGVSPHPKQGYHVKVTVNAPGAKGADTKHKVFWVEPCGGSLGTTSILSTTTTSTTTTTIAGGGSTSVGGIQQVQNQASATTPVNTSRLAVLGEVIERSPAKVAAVAAAPAAAGVNAGSTARVLGTTVERAALARTGLNALQLLTLGALTILAGIAAVRAARRKSEPGSPFVI
ncbi:MAG TPA: hypothetical protein VM142_05450 [Acidimicrobiales bacterium]|nr:hypothetical protein [Acidimicrobiales bacterium]